MCDCQPGYQLTNGLSCSDINECNTDNGGCSQVCINQVGSYYCQCNNGYTLDDDGHGCTGMIVLITLNVYITTIDIDECITNNGGCEQMCTNTIGSFNCSCTDGYNLKSGKVCAGKINFNSII